MTLPPSYFEQLHAAKPDPWGFESRWYEQRKYALTAAALPRERYQRGLEVGCSIGVLTELLASRCDSLLALDASDSAVAAARRRLAGRSHVSVEQAFVPEDWPEGSFDLVVLSEVGYYFVLTDLQRLLDKVAHSLSAVGSLVVVHWRHPVADYPLRGDEVHAAVAALPGLRCTVSHLEADFVLEVYQRPPARSVAQETGLVP